MNHELIEDQVLEKVNDLTSCEYSHCRFLTCDLSGKDLSAVVFSDCEFKSCNLTMAGLSKSSFRNVLFQDCKLTGLRFDQCNPFLFEVRFSNCQLDLSSFFGMKLKKTRFENCKLIEADFTQSDLTEAMFQNSDLDRAIFNNSILAKADLRTSENIMLDPERNNLKKAKFSLRSLPGLLAKYELFVEE